MKRIGVIGHRGYDGIPAILTTLLEIAPSLDLSLAFEAELFDLVDGAELLQPNEPVDAIVTLGGDGTFLRGVRFLEGQSVPILGVNMGRLGFLTSCGVNEIELAIRRFAANDYVAEPRMALYSGVLDCHGNERVSWLALNDVVLHKGGHSRVARFSVSIDDEPIGAYLADGLVMSTPTGSTAYSLSAGGPIVVPTFDSIVLTPVSAHTLAMRPVVLPPTSIVAVQTDDGPEKLLVTIDGQFGTTFGDSECLVIRRALNAVQIVRFPGTSFFSHIRRKLGWGGLSERDGAVS